MRSGLGSWAREACPKRIDAGRVTPGTADTAFPFLTVLVLLPAGAALVAAFVPRSLGEAASAARGRVDRRREHARDAGALDNHRRAIPRQATAVSRW